MQILVESGADIAECKNIRFENGRLPDCGSDGSTVIWNREEALDRLFEDKLVRSYAWDKLYRKALWKDIRFPKGKYYEDIFIMHKVFEKANKVVFLKKGLYYYRIRSGSVMHSDDMELAMDRLHSLEVRYSSVEAKGREKYAPAQFFYSVQIVQRKLYMLHLSRKLKRKYHKEINTYALKYCKGSTLTKRIFLSSGF